MNRPAIRPARRALLTGAAALTLALATPATAGAATPTTDPACTVTYTIKSQFPSHFFVSISINNTGPTAINSWRLTWTFTDGQRVTNMFGARAAQTGPDVSADSLPWDSTIQPGAILPNVGFYGTWNNATNSIPTVSCQTT